MARRLLRAGISERLDGDKLGVYLEDGDVAAEVMLRRRDGSVDYDDGEA